jgi:hypothetical protein
MGEPVTTGAGGAVVAGAGTVAPSGEAPPAAAKGEPFKDLLNRLNLEGTAQQFETVIRWAAERGAEVLR